MNTSPVKFQNPRTQEVWLCDDPGNVRKIDGVSFIIVKREGTQREVLMRKDSLVRVKSK